MDLVTYFLKNIGSTGWWQLLNSYNVGALSFGSYSVDAYSAGKSLTQSDVWPIVSNALKNDKFASSTDAIYILLTSR